MNLLYVSSEIAAKDIAESTISEFQSPIDQVGMAGLIIPILVNDQSTSASFDIFVNLTKVNQKGIHMSRLHKLAVDTFSHQPLQPDSIPIFLNQLIASQSPLSTNAYLQIAFPFVMKQPALKSDYEGWINYPISLSFALTPKGLQSSVEFTLTYSSACPCSAALSRELLIDDFKAEFSDHAKIDTNRVEQWLESNLNTGGLAHAQRSTATVRLDWKDLTFLDRIHTIIQSFEHVLNTPVQAAVKRIDEREFARLNALYQKFCEDAVRQLKHEADQHTAIADYKIDVCHEESLHPHNAVARVVKGLPNGYTLL